MYNLQRFFSNLVGYLFILVIVSFAVQKLSSLMCVWGCLYVDIWLLGLDSTYEGKHVIFVLLSLAYFV
jgi:hypothetical protein